MYIQSKRIKMIVMTEGEVKEFKELMDRASKGHTSHYAESESAMPDGSYMGVRVQQPDELNNIEQARRNAPIRRNHNETEFERAERERNSF